MIRAIVIDEHTSDVDVLCKQLLQTDGTIKMVKKFREVADALSYFTKFPVDLVFLDDSKSGQTSELFDQGQNICFVHFSSQKKASSDCVRRDFIAQDVRENLNHWVGMVEEKRSKSNQDFSLFVRADFELHQIYFKDLMYAESLGDYIKFVLDGKRPLVVKMSMKALEETLPKDAFIRVHRSYILNKVKILKVRTKSVLVSGQEIPVGTTYLNRLQEILL